jgi:hypothetical protein
VVTNAYHPIKYMCRAAHILSVSQRHKMEMIGMSSTEIWNWRNGLCLHKEIDKKFKALDLVCYLIF